MKRSHVAFGITAVLAGATLAALPATAATAAPKAATAKNSPPSDVREIRPDQKYSTAKLGSAKSSARASQRPGLPLPWCS